MDCSPSFANFSGLGETFPLFPPPGAATVKHYFVCVGSSLPKPYSNLTCAYARRSEAPSAPELVSGGISYGYVAGALVSPHASTNVRSKVGHSPEELGSSASKASSSMPSSGSNSRRLKRAHGDSSAFVANLIPVVSFVELLRGVSFGLLLKRKQSKTLSRT